MKDYFKILKNIFNKLGKNFGGDSCGLVRPGLYWKFLIFVSIFGFIFIMLLNAYLFLYFDRYYFSKNTRQDLSEVENRSPDKKRIIKVYEELKQREENFSKLMKEKPFIDEP